jgi:hypothetical protein
MTKYLVLLATILALLIPGCRKEKDPIGDQLIPGDQGTEQWKFTFQPLHEVSDCTELQANSFFANTTAALVPTCNLTMQPDQTITRKLIFQGAQSSGVTLNCGGGTIGDHNDDIVNIIEIRATHRGGIWVPPHDITIQNCYISGGVRLYGKGMTAGAKVYRESSYTLQHVSDTRNSSPYYITLDNVTIEGEDHVIVYFGPGTHHSTLKNSTLYGTIHALLYLGAESFGNTIENNTFNGDFITREAIAVDASASNRIISNTILNVANGGIFLYRNCGEKGTVRHTTPSNNEITDNEILHQNPIWPLATQVGIYLGSRDGGKGYCHEDDGYPYGSSISDQDHARFNMVTGNTLWNCTVETGNRTNHSNAVQNNTYH